MMMISHPARITCVVMCLICAGCGGGQSSGVGDATTEMQLVVPGLDVKTGVSPVSEAQAMTLVKEIQQAIENQSPDQLYGLLNQGVFFDRVFHGIPVSERSRSGFMQGVNQSGGLRVLTKQIIDQVQAGGSYRFVRLVKSGGSFHPLFRLSLPNSGTNYHQLTPIQSNNRIMMADIHVMLSGELMSTSLRRNVIPLAAYENRSLIERLAGAEADYVQHAQEVAKLAPMAQQQNLSGFMAIYDKLPDSLQRDRNVLMLRLLVSQQNEESYVQVLKLLETSFPNDPSNDFRAIDRYALQKDFAGALAAVDRVLDHTQDPFLNTLRVDPLIALDRPQEAMDAAKLAIEAEPDNLQVYWTGIGAALLTKNYAQVAKLLTTVENRFDMTFDNLAIVPEYADFVKSEEYRQWLNR